MGENEELPHNPIPAMSDDVELTDAQRLREELVFSAINVFLNPIPYIGAAFNELRQMKAHREMERLSSFTQELRELIAGVSAESVNWDYLRSEHFQDFFLGRWKLL